MVRIALAGDTMLGRLVAERLETEPPSALFAPELVEIAHEADVFVLNLEGTLSPWWQWVIRGAFLLLVVVIQGRVQRKVDRE